MAALVPKTPSSISSDADVVIGATFNSNHGVPQNSFSGLLSDVSLYTRLLDSNSYFDNIQS